MSAFLIPGVLAVVACGSVIALLTASLIWDWKTQRRAGRVAK